jgi:hypothetical protein
MINKKLKQGKFKCGDVIVDRYILENEDDLKAFNKEFDLLRQQKESFPGYFDEGIVIILTERNISGFNSYCFECKDKTSTHPGSFIRV